MKKLNSRPEIQTKRLERVKQFNTDPYFVSKRRKNICNSIEKRKESCRKIHTDEELKKKRLAGIRKYFSNAENNPISLLDKWQREEYDFLVRKKKFSREEALKLILKDFPGLYRLIMMDSKHG